LEDSDIKERPTVVKKILQSTLPRHEPETAEAAEKKPYEDARSRDEVNLEIRFSDGTRKFFSLVGLEAEFDPGDEHDTLTLHFLRAEVIVTGRALLSLYEKLLDQRARFIKQGTQAEGDLRDPNVPYVEQIEIHRKED
jgi:hypothetical protein